MVRIFRRDCHVKLVFKDSELPRFLLYGRYLPVTEQILVVVYSTVLDIVIKKTYKIPYY